MKRPVNAVLIAVSSFSLGIAATHIVHAQAKPKAYTIAEIDVTDPGTFQKYGQGTGATVPAAGGKFVVRAGRTYVLNGAPPKRIAIIEWDSFEHAQKYYESDGYKELVPFRDKGANVRGFVVEGVPQ
jgi:uncharacterized protein (DUF1330 family)